MPWLQFKSSIAMVHPATARERNLDVVQKVTLPPAIGSPLRPNLGVIHAPQVNAKSVYDGE
jgi:hypothetical protein